MMSIEKIEIKPGQYVWVDKDAKINVNDWMIREVMNFPVQAVVDFHWDFGVRYHKVIASSPSLQLEGVPDYVEWLAEQELNNDWDLYESLVDGHISYRIGIDIIKMLFIKGYQTAEQEIKNDKWLSPVDTERKWQEEKLVEIFYHYPNASPAWQYMNGLIHIALESKNKFTEEDMKKAIKLARLREPIMGLFTYEPEQIIEQIKSEKN